MRSVILEHTVRQPFPLQTERALMNCPASVCLTILLLPLCVGSALSEEAPDIGNRLELFVDRHRIASMNGARLKLHPPDEREVALRTDAPWEGPGSAYFTVFEDGDRFRMYYRGTGVDGEQFACTAESTDGIEWVRPEVAVFEHNGSTANNIVWKGPPHDATHNFAPFKDSRAGVPADQRYKALAGAPLFAFASADGLKWRLLREEPVITKGKFDSQNLAFWDPNKNKYVSYFRLTHEKRRYVALCTSNDFLTWTEPQLIDVGDTPKEHFYTNATVPYFRAPHYYFAFPKRFEPERKRLNQHPHKGVSDGIFLSSRDGVFFDRTFMEALIRPGRDQDNWGDRSNMTAWGILQTAPDEMSIYYSQNYRHPTHRIRRGVFRLDGIASVNAGYTGGELITKNLRFTGRHLVLNCATSAAGSIRVELQDHAGQPIPRFDLSNAPEFYGDSIAEAYKWDRTDDVSSLAGKVIRIRFILKDADIFSYRFAP